MRAVDDRHDPALTSETATAAQAGMSTVTLMKDGQRHSFRMPRDVTILDAVKARGLALPYSCRAGVCAVCRVKVVEGTVATRRNKALEEWEVRAGYVLACEARPTSDRLDITCDEA